jgi:superfamily II DNA or RNA helicase
MNAGMVLTSLEEEIQIREIVERHCENLTADDKDALEYHHFIDDVASGISCHHAGMIPMFKEAVEECFVQGLVKVVFATETLAVGINMPRIFNLILIDPGKSFVRVIQSIGRGLRKASDKDSVQIYDLTSDCKFSKRHLTQRKAFYKEAQYPFSVTKLDYK